MTDAQLRSIWLETGRAGVAKLFAATQRAGLGVRRAAVDAFIKKQETRQIFAPAPKSDGKVTSNTLDGRWQIDLIDFKQLDATKNDGHKNVLVATDVFSRFVWAVPLKDKSQNTVTTAFRGIMASSGRRPAEVDSDGGAEFSGVFDKLMVEKGIAHRTKNPKQVNSLAIVDATIKKLKDTIKQEMAEAGSGTWLSSLGGAVKAANGNSNDYLMGSRPSDVKGSAALQYTLKKQAGTDAMLNNKVNSDRIAALRATMAFRVLLPAATWQRTTIAKWSNEVHQVKSFIGAEVVDEKGKRFPLRETLPVDVASSAAQAPADLRGQARQFQQRDALSEFSTALTGFLGAAGLTLQGVGTKLRKVPGFNEAMAEQKITGNGAMERFLALFPDLFALEGEAQRKRVNRR
jgi:hypothetical protein